MNRIFPYIVLTASLSLAGTAAYYSVFGLSKLFSSQATAVIIMASILESSKLITASFLHRQWKSISKLLKGYLISAVFVLMCITSLGIYGFLVSAYQETAYKLKTQDAKISVLELKKDRYQTQVLDIRVEKESLNKNITELTTGLSNNVIQYTNAEGVVITTTSSATRRTLEKQLQQTTDRRDTLYSKEIAYSDSVSNLDLQMLKLQTESKVSAEVGPIKYVAQRVNQPVDTVVNWFILLFIFVFDPLAIMLLVSANSALANGGKMESKAKRVKAPTSDPPTADVEISPEKPDISPVEKVKEDIYQEQPKQKQKRVILKSEIL